MVRVLITGMSGTGKSTLVRELRRRGYAAYDADDDGYTEPRAGGRWGWRAEAVRELFDRFAGPVLYFSGCSDEQAQFDFDLRVLLTAPESVIVDRLQARTTNAYGKLEPEMALVLSDVEEVEPLLRRRAGVIVETTASAQQVADVVINHVAQLVADQ